MIYLYHIQRTGGRSLTLSILGDFQQPGVLWHRCHGSLGEGPIIEEEGKKIIPWHGDPARFGIDFFFSWSHIPAFGFELPPGCFTITILRDPVTRFISMYRYLRKFDYIDVDRIPAHFDPHQYLRPTILETVEALPPIHRYQMLYHFSETLDEDEAVERIGGLSYWFRMENYEQGLADLRELLGLSMPWTHHKDDNITERTEREVASELTEDTRARLTEIFRPEYQLLRRLQTT